MCADKIQEVLVSAIDVPRQRKKKKGKSEIIKSDDTVKYANHTLKRLIIISDEMLTKNTQL